MSQKPVVYRLRRLPAHADRQDVQVHSLANAVDPWERYPTRTATLTFKKPPFAPGARPENGVPEWSIPVLGLSLPLLLDSHFIGVTPLNDVPPSEHEYEYVLIAEIL
jgi:hypothetical protein